MLSDRDLWSGHRVSVPFMRAGGVGLGLSVLYSPFDEMDSNWPDGPPKRSYFGELLRQLDRVEEEIATRWTDADVTVVKTAGELAAARDRDAIALVHCVEGGFHLGEGDEEIDANAAELVRRGVAYVTVAHRFYREVAANAPAIPFLSFLPDRWYDRLLGQPAGEGLTARGRRAIEALHRNRILIDVSHMRADVLGEGLDLLDELDPDEGLRAAYSADAELITSGNTIRVLNALWSLRDEAAGPVNR